jgi:hypothetical protein
MSVYGVCGATKSRQTIWHESARGFYVNQLCGVTQSRQTVWRDSFQ